SVSWPSTVQRFRQGCSRVSYSVTSEGRLPVRWHTALEDSKRPIVAPCFSTRSEICQSKHSRNCFGRFRSSRSSVWEAVVGRCTSTCALLPRPTRIYLRWFSNVHFALISSTG